MMKRLLILTVFILHTSLFISYAQLQFVDKEGKAITGSEVTCTEVEEDFFGDKQINLPVYVKNTSSASINATATIQLSTIDNGTLQCCAFGSCSRYKAVGTYTRPTLAIDAGNTHDMQTEWLPSEYGKCTMTISLMNADDNSVYQTLKVNFVNADPAGIVQIVNGEQTVCNSACYNLAGQRVAPDSKGILIKNGKKIIKH